MRGRAALFSWCAALALVAALARPASAYPQFQFSSGTNRCAQCHVSPAGGGLISAWGRDESGDTISRGGDGSFLHGLFAPPSWLGLGGDFRLASLGNSVGGPESPELVTFPMQADIYLRALLGDAFSINVIAGDRGITRPTSPTTSGRLSSALHRGISREHFLMWRPSATGPYVRAGRFFAPYGLRMVEHIFYVRRYTGSNLYEEPYALSGGYVDENWELHASAFAPVPESFPDSLQSVGFREKGGALYFEHRIAGMAALGVQARVGVASEEARYQGGAVGKLWLEPAKLLFMGEADVIRQTIKGTGGGQTQLVSYLGATFFPIRGLMTGVAYERYHEDVAVSKTARNAFDIEFNFFPWAHIEFVLLGRFQTNGDGASGSMGMFQFHYYL
jgi:hypothetical protein